MGGDPRPNGKGQVSVQGRGLTHAPARPTRFPSSDAGGPGLPSPHHCSTGGAVTRPPASPLPASPSPSPSPRAHPFAPAVFQQAAALTDAKSQQLFSSSQWSAAPQRGQEPAFPPAPDPTAWPPKPGLPAPILLQKVSCSERPATRPHRLRKIKERRTNSLLSPSGKPVFKADIKDRYGQARMCVLAPGCLMLGRQTLNHHSLVTWKPDRTFPDLGPCRAAERGVPEGQKKPAVGWGASRRDRHMNTPQQTLAPTWEGGAAFPTAGLREGKTVTQGCQAVQEHTNTRPWLPDSRREPSSPGPVLPTKTLSFPGVLSKQYKCIPTPLGWVIRVRPRGMSWATAADGSGVQPLHCHVECAV